MSHTPGPIYCRDCKPVYLNKPKPGVGSVEDIQLCRRHHAVPDLLAALGRADGEITNMLDACSAAPSRIAKGYQERLLNVQREARAAIRKATAP